MISNCSCLLWCLRYFDIFTGYLLELIPGGSLWAFLFFILSIVLNFICRWQIWLFLFFFVIWTKYSLSYVELNLSLCGIHIETISVKFLILKYVFRFILSHFFTAIDPCIGCNISYVVNLIISEKLRRVIIKERILIMTGKHDFQVECLMIPHSDIITFSYRLQVIKKVHELIILLVWEEWKNWDTVS